MKKFFNPTSNAREMDANRRELILQRWNVIQHELLPELRNNDVGPLTPKLVKVIHTLEWVRIEEFVQSSWCGIRPRLTLGDKATINTWLLNGVKQDLEGEIVRVDRDLATYTVMVPALGHVREGLGTHGHIVPFEDLHSIVTPVDEFELAPTL